MPSARLAIALHSTAESLGWLAKELGIFRDLGLDIEIDLEVSRTQGAGPRVAHGLVNDTWQFGDVGAGPIVEANLQGHDAVILLAAEPPGALYMMGRAGITEPGQCAGARIGVLSERGQTVLSAKALLRRWGVLDTVSFSYLGTYPRIYDALGRAEIDACVFTADYRFRARRALGASLLTDSAEALRFQGPIAATTRRMIASDRDTVRRFVMGYVETIRAFKSDRDRVLPLLRRYLSFPEPGVVEDIYDHYAESFLADPYPSEAGVAALKEEYRAEYPNAGAMPAAQCIDSSLLDEALAARGSAGA